MNPEKSQARKRQQRQRVARFLTWFSILLAGGSTALWWQIHRGGGESPLWLSILLAYSWIFTAFFGLNGVARTFSRKKPPLPAQTSERKETSSQRR
ncbi:MAG TPA: hypothetical protein VFV52_12250 [Bacilli bacterium]|nr:hypothetical protein [Bacilli bacterium]